jgi:hypothetical protein
MVVLLKGLIWQLLIGPELILGTRVGEYTAKIFTKFALELARSLSNQARGTVSSAVGKYNTFMLSSPPANSID